MVPLADPRIRFVLLSHLATWMGDFELERARLPDTEMQRIARLRELSVLDLGRLSSMQSVAVSVVLDLHGLEEGLRALADLRERRSLEAYFLRHGASWRLMASLFKVQRRDTLRRRRVVGVRRPPGRFRLPGPDLRERIHHVWVSYAGFEPRERFWRLHRHFPAVSFSELEAVLRTYEVWP